MAQAARLCPSSVYCPHSSQVTLAQLRSISSAQNPLRATAGKSSSVAPKAPRSQVLAIFGLLAVSQNPRLTLTSWPPHEMLSLGHPAGAPHAGFWPLLSGLACSVGELPGPVSFPFAIALRKSSPPPGSVLLHDPYYAFYGFVYLPYKEF